MPLPKSIEREKLHDRQIHCEGFKRVDGLWDIEAHLVDKRTFDCSYDEKHRDGIIKAGEPVHDMFLRITINIKFTIQEVHAVSDDTPFNVCPNAALAMQKLIGLRIGTGWIRQVRKRIGPNISCTHLMDLLPPIAATAYQTLYAELEDKAKQLPKRDKPAIIDTCLALAADGEVVLNRWPEFYELKT
ncbi:MAG: hypothetical protein ACI88H_000168 [Cocleimonas sp.]|jgi:hypothetical protein